MRILLVEDDEFISTTLEKVLVEQHYVVDIATNGQMGWELVEAFTYDLIVLDIILPELDGIRFCQQLRANNYQMPVLLLTAQNSSTDKVKGLDAGADDYLVKPFEISELLARIRVLLRRRNSPNLAVLEWSNLRLDTGICEVTYNGCELYLTPKEYRLLELFLRNNHRVFSRSAILDHLWPHEEAPSEDAVTVHIKDLRQKLKQVGAPADLIETVYGRGYRLKQLSSPPSAVSGLPVQMQENLIHQKTRAELASVWEKYRERNYNRLAVLKKATLDLLENKLTEEQHQQAQRTAHKLAGALGIFGFAEASGLAREIEEILTQQTLSREASRLSDRVAALIKILKHPVSADFLTAVGPTLTTDDLQPHKTVQTGSRVTQPLVVVVDQDIELAKRLLHLGRAQRLLIEMVPDVPAMREKLQASTSLSESNIESDILLLNLSLTEPRDGNLALLAELANQTPPIPVLLLTAQDDLSHRVKMAHLDVHTFLQQPLLPMQVLETVTRVRSQVQATTPKVMVVDDDAALLAGIRALLEPLGIELATLEQPLQFWHDLAEFSPDLVILDLEMPHFSGIDLCRVLRNTPQWRELPILFLTIHADTDTASQLFAAGANDCMSKTIGRSELKARILKRLEKVRFLRSVAASDRAHP